MKHILLIFLDGIGLGANDPATNPFAAAQTPTLQSLSNGLRWLQTTGAQYSDRAVFIPTDAQMGVEGKPQSASGQATILTGRNIPQLIGEHYGPRPNQAIRDLIHQDNFFKRVIAHNLPAALLEGYPPRWHETVNRGKRLRSSYQEAAHSAGLKLFTEKEIYDGDALAVDWTGEGWRKELGYTDSPVYTPIEAGTKMAHLGRRYAFSFFSHWVTDTIGHRGTLEDGVHMLEVFDGVMAGALATWRDEDGLMIITSDHGNMEDLSHTKHTENHVPTVIIGAGKEAFAEGLHSLADIVPSMSRYLFGKTEH
jgi:bisphosphoglycerate-independent phosphoglycerate mutase (AlkP superfamily)